MQRFQFKETTPEAPALTLFGGVVFLSGVDLSCNKLNLAFCDFWAQSVTHSERRNNNNKTLTAVSADIQPNLVSVQDDSFAVHIWA